MAFRPGKCLLHNILREKKLTPQEFANISGFSKQQISDYINNRRRMSLSNARTISQLLECPIEDLYIWIDTSRKRSKQTE